ncbi:hypothetical protein ABC383_15280 [Noviherbaspirillum sp. 1P10PC]|uniref:hypothetical protein n=1 Tax=Noviherbaspirillum sp. 1P10PC TaxID=3132292 RepID=UPI00399FE43C
MAAMEAIGQRVWCNIAAIGMHATLLCLALCVAVTCHAWPTRQASERPIPPELQALFEEAEGTFPIKTLHGMPEAQNIGVYWLDNHRAIYTVRKLPGWEARSDERSKIIIYDVDAGTYEETSYRGDLKCLGTERQVLVQDYALPYSFTIQPGDTKEDTRYFLSGTLGQPLTRFKRPHELGMLVPFSCRFYDNADHNFGMGDMLGALRPGDGVLDSTLGGDIQLVSPEGKTKWAIKIDWSCNLFPEPVYLPWMNRYYTQTSWSTGMQGCDHVEQNAWLFSTEQIQTLSMPGLIRELLKPDRQLGGNGTTYWARPGMFVYVQYSTGLNGLYWIDEKAGKLKRVFKNPWRLQRVSPDGCRNLVMTTPAVLIELCKGQTQ